MSSRDPVGGSGGDGAATDSAVAARGVSGTRQADAFAATTPALSAESFARGRASSEDETILAPDSLPEPSVKIGAGERYSARGVLGAGGMGEVRLTKDQWIGREVAHKTLHPEVGLTRGSRARFLREIRVQGQLEHPAIVPVYDVGTTEAGELWFTMRRIRGKTLSDILVGLAAGEPELTARFSRRKLLNAFNSIALVVHYAHTRGVVHRDLKPGNVMLGDFGEVYVLDWGIAKIVGVEDGADALLANEESTGSGRVIGTLGYMAPEQARGQAADARTDVYALGVILFELLTHESLMRETDAMKALESIVEGLVARPSERRPDAEIPPELDEICARATARDPKDRFASAKELSDAVERFLDGDRDLERRRELSESYLEAAQRSQAAAADSPSAAHRARVGALRDVLRAVALSPEHPRAVESLARLVLEPPKGMPEEAMAEREALDNQARTEGALLGYRAFLSFILSFPLMVIAGVRSWWLVAGGWLCVVAAAFIARHFYKRRITQSLQFGIMLGLCAVVVLVQGTWLGPFVLMPMATTIVTAIFALYSTKKERPFVIAAGLCMALLPFAAELVPGIPRGFTFEDGKVVLHPRALDLPPVATTIGLLYTTAGYAILPALFLIRLKETLRGSEDRLFLQAWTLKQLFPAARGSG